MRQCENIFVFIDLTKSIGSDLGGQFFMTVNQARVLADVLVIISSHSLEDVYTVDIAILNILYVH